ncbi:MAG: putative DNA modification/repair radical SAM protein [Odoribacteraceae bacterium]|jgi:putative DNA modification/repair radical SAM protein|nr:putative DNA modification/repair radical SAM protein [Odoribacteraceae bacterium]
MDESTFKKLKTLAGAAKYDATCASAVSGRHRHRGWGICHGFSADGRCISLLKIMLTNHCIHDCAYCINRRENDVARATFSVAEIVDLTMELYRRNYIEGLFLSSGVLRDPDYTMERLARVAKELRVNRRFKGYLHLKSIPGASRELVHQAGLHADCLSVNVEIPTEVNLRAIAPGKSFRDIFQPMRYIHEHALQSARERRFDHRAPPFAPAGQSTQVIVGATPDTDREILRLSSSLYRASTMRRVYYSAFIPVNAGDDRLPNVDRPPLAREHRLYQADWLLRFYGFELDELVDAGRPFLDLDVDPKLAWALRHPAMFPVDVNRAGLQDLLRVPGLGPRSARFIMTARGQFQLGAGELVKIGLSFKKARHFISCRDIPPREVSPERVRGLLLPARRRREEESLPRLPFRFD